MTAKQVFLFDWDGTVIDSLEVKIANAEELFNEELGIERSKVGDSYRSHSGIPRQQLFDAICMDNGLDLLSPDLYQSLSRRFSELNLISLTTLPVAGLVTRDTRATLDKLQNKGYPLYISSSATTEEIQAIATALNLSPYFKEILGSSGGFGKGLGHINYIKNKEGVERSQMIFIGDDIQDIRLGKEAGVYTIAKVGTHSLDTLFEEKPDLIIWDLSELLGLINAESNNKEN